MPKVKIYDATVGKEVDHELEVDQNGEIVATSVDSGHFVKFPAGLTKTQFTKALADHKKATETQEVISEEELQEREANLKKSQDLLDSFN